jgi:hypothetical protein
LFLFRIVDPGQTHLPALQAVMLFADAALLFSSLLPPAASTLSPPLKVM